MAQGLSAQYCSLNELLQRSDFVVVTVDLNAESKALIGAEQLAQMQPHAVLVNISRGPVIDEQALIEALKANQIFAAGLDVYEKEPLKESELFELDNVITLPHVGSATVATRRKMAELAYQNLVDVLEGRVPRYVVNPQLVHLSNIK